MKFREDLLDVTWIVATHNRKAAIEELIHTLKIHYPKMPLIIVDSSDIKNNDINSSNYIYINTW